MQWSKQIHSLGYKKSEGRQVPALVQLLSDVIQDRDAFYPLVLPSSVHWYSPSCFSLVVLKWLLHSLQKASGQYSRQKEVEILHQQSLVERVNVFPEFPAAAEFPSDFIDQSWSQDHSQHHRDQKIEEQGYHKWFRPIMIHNLRLATLLP